MNAKTKLTFALSTVVALSAAFLHAGDKDKYGGAPVSVEAGAVLSSSH